MSQAKQRKLITFRNKMIEERFMKDIKTFGSKCLTAFSYLLVLGVVLLRIELINPYNVVPVFSCLLFFAAVRPQRELVLPFCALVGADIFVTTHGHGYALTPDAVVTWAWYLLAILLGSGVLRNSRSLPRVAACSLLASVSFFLVSNYTVWAVWQMYPRTLVGLVACYAAALPFFRNSLTSELCSGVLLSGLMGRIGSVATFAVARKVHCELFSVCRSE
jgi:hypothetical protein